MTKPITVTLEKVKEIGNEYYKIISQHYKMNLVSWELMGSKTAKTYGVCKTARKTGGFSISSIIRINPNLKYEKDLREVIAHELTHAIIECLDANHNSKWQRIAYDVCVNILGLDGGYQRTSDRELNNISRIKVKFKITSYGARFQKRKEFKNTEKIHECEIVGKRTAIQYKSLETNNVIEIIEWEKVK